ncbi:hypothetical protein AB6A40_009403 [Gnathostoma spinigerum]|uniref:Pseudouridylate synthase 1 homolog n=1 Tax=Gnathostoma spinigerum TaxID=75299 RepID=A0ABD6ERV9_9BILA
MTKTIETVTKMTGSLHKVIDGKIVKEKNVGDAAVAGTSAIDGSPQKKRRKTFRYAMLLAYQGKKYFGMQIQKDFPTIESNLLSAMVKLQLIKPEEAERPNSFWFQRAARTDRSVSAACQLCSMKLLAIEQPLSVVPDALNEYLPDDIRVLGVRRATRTFNAQKDCDSRTYSYTLPTFAFAKTDELTTAKFRISKDTIEEVESLLHVFVGTHNFFNYTSGRNYEDRSCYRYIMSFECGEPFIFNDDILGKEIEFVTLTIRGQSFMLHQIRKMIGIVIAIVRGLMYKSDIQRSFEEVRMDVPRAPGLGLLLEKLHYKRYDEKYSATHEKLDDWGEEVDKKTSDVREKLIMSEILRQECSTDSMMLWLSDLFRHNFISDPEDDETSYLFKPDDASNVAVECQEASVSEAGKATHVNESEDNPNNSDTIFDTVIKSNDNQASMSSPTLPASSDTFHEVPLQQKGES